MKKLHSLTFYALVTPAIAFSAGSLLAQPAGQPAGQPADRAEQSTQRDENATPPTTRTAPISQSAPRAGQTDAQRTSQTDAQRAGQAADSQRPGQANAPAVAASNTAHEQARMKNRGFLSASPANGMEASNLIGAEVMATGDEDVGTVDDLIIDENGQVVAIIVGVGGFLGMAEKDVAIGWDDVTRSGDSDEQELRIVMTRDGLMSAPEYKRAE